MSATWKRAIGALRQIAICGTVASLVWFAGANEALGAPKKKEEPAAAPTKSYTVPYMIVLAMLGLGMMSVCRPSGRLEKVEDKLKTTKDEE